MAEHTILHPETTLGAVTLIVSDLERSLAFYEKTIGLRRISSGEGQVEVGAGGRTLLILKEKKGAIPQPTYSTGLFHVAILVPSRLDLVRAIYHFAETRYSLQGYADHNVSEAFYLADPDGNGLEIYRDRPRSEWRYRDGALVMGTYPIDLEDFFAELGGSPPLWRGLPDGTRIGHMHLRVGNIQKAQAFYHEVIGFEVMAAMSGAAFLAAGGYHHHLGLNVWQSQDAPPPPVNAVGLEEFTVILPNAAEQEHLMTRLKAAHHAYEQDGAALLVSDPWGNTLRFTVA